MFDAAAQARFAALSGDWNPIHLDPVAARRELTGDVVAHGLHVLLRALESALGRAACGASGPVHFQRIACRFRSPVYLGQPVSFRAAVQRPGALRVEALAGDRPVLSARVAWAPAGPRGPDSVPAAAGGWRGVPRPLSFPELAGCGGETPLALAPALAQAMFPRLLERAGAALLADLLAATRVVGMECPGLQSMFAELDLAAVADPAAAGFQYSVAQTDDRMARVELRVQGRVLGGTLVAFHRPRPVSQLPFADASRQVSPGEFSGQRALVVGGTRGLGEVTAKLLAAGGAEVVLTYRVGAAEAEQVCAEIVAGGGRASPLCYDTAAAGTGLAALRAAGFRPTHVYYFPTPRVTRGGGPRLDPGLLRAYLEVYVEAFANLHAALVEWTRAPLAFFYPSSIVVAEQDRDLMEYGCAKAAGEALCSYLSRHVPSARIAVARLPVVATDLSQGLLAGGQADPAPVMLPLLRSLHSGAA